MKDWNQTRSCEGEINIMKLYQMMQIYFIAAS